MKLDIRTNKETRKIVIFFLVLILSSIPSALGLVSPDMWYIFLLGLLLGGWTFEK